MSREKLAILYGRPVRTKPLPEYNSLGKEEGKAAEKLIRAAVGNKALLSGYLGRSGKKFLGGPEVCKLEETIKKHFKIRYAVSCNSATTGLQMAVAAARIGPGDQVITSPFTMPATATAILLNNAVPVFADIDPDTFCITAESIEKRITKQTRAILVVNIFGGVADYNKILRVAKKYKLIVIEDNAQAPGATYKGKFAGTIGEMGILSFNVHKAIQAGEGGMLLTNNKRFAYRAQLVRNHGEAVMDDVWESEPKTRELLTGSNYRLSELHATIIRPQLKRLTHLNDERIVRANYLTKQLKQIDWLEGTRVTPRTKHVYYLYPIKFKKEAIGIKRETVIKAFTAEGFPVKAGYQKPLYLLPAFKRQRIFERSQFPFVSKEYPQKFSYKKGLCPTTERMFEKELITTKLCQPPKTKRMIDEFIRACKKIEANKKELKAWENKKSKNSR
jgi:perosamine synthetase